MAVEFDDNTNLSGDDEDEDDDWVMSLSFYIVMIEEFVLYFLTIHCSK